MAQSAGSSSSPVVNLPTRDPWIFFFVVFFVKTNEENRLRRVGTLAITTGKGGLWIAGAFYGQVRLHILTPRSHTEQIHFLC